MNTKEKVMCPYCETTNNISIELSSQTSSQIIRCDNEIGGCDMEFVMKIIVTTSIYSLKIENIDKF